MKSALFVSIVSALILLALEGWVFMLVVQVVHNHWISQVPTIGYYWAVTVVVGLRGVLFQNTSKS